MPTVSGERIDLRRTVTVRAAELTDVAAVGLLLADPLRSAAVHGRFQNRRLTDVAHAVLADPASIAGLARHQPQPPHQRRSTLGVTCPPNPEA
jgi:hypothetical protein